jgi:2-methylcitrate dehydratase PrpD
LLSDRTDRPAISTGREAQVSVQHAVAAALVFGEAGVRQFTDAAANDPRVIDLRSRVEVIRDANISNIAAEVDIWTTDGKKHSLSIPAARGSSPNPMSDKEVEDKLRSVAADWEPGHPIQLLIDKVWSIDRAEDASELLALLIPSGGMK